MTTLDHGWEKKHTKIHESTVIPFLLTDFIERPTIITISRSIVPCVDY